VRSPLTTRVVLALFAFAIATAASPQGPLEATDSRGTRVRLSAPAQRIVSLAPGITELLFEAGAGAKVMGADDASDFPPAAKTIQRVGNSMAINLEQVAALRPDLVIAWPHGAAQRQMAGLRALGVPVFLADPDSIDAIANTLILLGRLAGTDELARRQADVLRNTARRISSEHQGRQSISAYVQIWDHPLMTINGRHLISNALQLCGIRNVFAAEQRLTPTPGREAVIASDPQSIILLAGSSQASSWKQEWTRFPHLRAVRAGAIIAVDPDRLARPTSRLLDGVSQVCNALRRYR
jgi:iron complex transport system substrate-binding protein